MSSRHPHSRPTAPTYLAWILTAVVSWTMVAPAGAQLGTTFVLPDPLPDGAWIECTPLTTGASARWLPLDPAQAGQAIEPLLPGGATMVCHGAPGRGTACNIEILWNDDESGLLPSPAERAEDAVVAGSEAYAPGATPAETAVAVSRIELPFATGLPVEGHYFLRGLAVVGARVAVVPVVDGERQLGRPFTMPLVADSDPARSRSVRHVVTDDTGRFVLPPLAAGSYFLEASLPGGRQHRSDPFEIPTADPEAPASTVPEVWGLGSIDVAEGLSLEVLARGTDNEPLDGVRVWARQGRTTARLRTFETQTDAEGRAVLEGMTVDEVVTLGCEVAGRSAFRASYDLLPVSITCRLDPLAQVTASLASAENFLWTREKDLVDDIARGFHAFTAAFSRLDEPGDAFGYDPVDDEAVDGEAAGNPEIRVRVPYTLDARLQQVLPAGNWRLEVSAPAHRTAVREFSLGPGEHLDLEPLVLRAAPEITLRVHDPDGAPLAGAEVRSVAPPGAIAATTDADGEAVFGHPGLATRLEVQAFGYATGQLDLAVDADGPLAVTLRPGGWIRAEVTGAARPVDPQRTTATRPTPCAGCELWIEPGDHALVTDSAGEALSEALAPGWYRVLRPRLEHLGSTVVETRDAESRWARVEAGEITAVRFDTGGDEVLVRFDPPPGDTWSLIARGGGREQRVSPAGDGSYLLRRRQREPLELHLQGWQAWSEPSPYGTTTSATADGATVTVRVAALGMTYPGTLDGGFRFDSSSGGAFSAGNAERDDVVRLELPSGEVHGAVVVGPAERPGAGRTVRLFGLHDGGEAAVVRTRPDGTFRVPLLPPGAYRLQIGDLFVQNLVLATGQSLAVGTFRIVQ